VSAAARPGWLRDTAGLYARVFRRAAALALRNWPVALVLFGFGMLRDVLDGLIARLGGGPLSLVGGFLSYLVLVAFMSSWLFLVAEVIRTGRIQPRDWVAGLGAYFGDLLTVLFLFWIIVFVAQVLFLTAPLLGIVLGLALLTFGNAVPELVYLGRHPPAAILVESYRFIGENWIEWFPANILLACCVYGLGRLAFEVFPSLLVPELVSSLALYFAMIARGLLFQELATSSRRARAFRRAAE
jgi:hypothetical protein